VLTLVLSFFQVNHVLARKWRTKLHRLSRLNL